MRESTVRPDIAQAALGAELVPTSSLRPNPRNPRTHSKRQIRQIANSIKQFGFNSLILVGKDDVALIGNGRLAAAQLLGLPNVPVVQLDNLTPAQIRAYIIADNKISENAGWDKEILAEDLRLLLNFDLETGFDMGEIDALIGVGNTADDKADQAPALDTVKAPIAQPEDLWVLGRHRLICGDAMDPSIFVRLLDDERATAIFTDPPYNVRIPGHVSGKGKHKHADFVMASGEMSEAEFIAFLKSICTNLVTACKDGALVYVFMDWRHIQSLLGAAQGIFKRLMNICVWHKSNAGMGSFYRSQHELVAVFKAGKASHINNIALGTYGRNRSNVWSYAGLNSFQSDKDAMLASHPTMKPVMLVQDAILDSTNRNDIVLDPLMGSGTTIIAAERVGRRAYGIELDPRYVDVALRRFWDLTGIEPVELGSGDTFSGRERTLRRPSKSSRSKSTPTPSDHAKRRAAACRKTSHSTSKGRRP